MSSGAGAAVVPASIAAKGAIDAQDARAPANGDLHDVQSVNSALKDAKLHDTTAAYDDLKKAQQLHEIEHLGGAKGFKKWLAGAKPLPVHVNPGELTQYMPFDVTVEGSVFHTSFRLKSSGIGIPYSTICTAFGAGKHGEFKALFFYETWDDLLGHDVEYSVVAEPLHTGGATVNFFHEGKHRAQLTIGPNYTGLACGKGYCTWAEVTP